MLRYFAQKPQDLLAVGQGANEYVTLHARLQTDVFCP